MDIQVSPKVMLRVRIRVLYAVVEELAKGFGANEDKIDTIRKGVLDKQIVSEIIFNYLDKDNLLVAKVTLFIDWEKHRVLAKSESGETFELDPERSISEQISQIYVILVEHTKKLRKALNISNVNIRYNYTKDVWRDKEKLQQARELLGTSPAKDIAWSTFDGNADDQQDWDYVFEYISSSLAELKIKVEHNVPKPKDDDDDRS